MVTTAYKLLNWKSSSGIRFATVLFWVLAMLVLLRYEAYPELFTNTLRGYRSVLPETVLIQDSWSRIIINGIPAGYSHTSMNVEDKSKTQDIEISNRTQIKIAVMGQPLNLNIRSTLLLNPQYDLLKFESSVHTREISLNVTGKRTQERMYDITTEIGGSKTTRSIKIPKDVLLYSPMNTLALRKLRPGQSIAIKTLDPLSMTATRLIVKAVKKEQIQHNQESVEATLLTSTYQGMQLRSWIDKNGTVLRQETPMGWVIESCTTEEALKAVSSNKTPPELAANKTGAMLMKLIFSTTKNTKGHENGENNL